ncbi:hypothetical protein psal_cds_1195 [Pandoravirus salinus]|uniref:Uncharacterized protein n=1 Tax=Pandoravirus salinus TaxID=1349410 RepID=A0A291ATS3_9VIRU|nr:hypothetical protein psal_cds_1195 [Pandoravirus salinus]ATE82292.1 hypothetical protein psal_cds_1195 [Pandoravirus salinus]
MHRLSKENARLKALITAKKSSKPIKNKFGSSKSSVKRSPLHTSHEQNTPVIEGDSTPMTQEATKWASNRATATPEGARVRATPGPPHSQVDLARDVEGTADAESEPQVDDDDDARELGTEAFEFPSGSARSELIPVPDEVLAQFGPEEEGAEYEILVLPSGEFIRKRVVDE